MNALPKDMMEEIFRQLDVASWARCKAVSRDWSKTLSGGPPPASEIPWLWDSSFQTPNCNKIIDVSKDVNYKSRIPAGMRADSNNPFVILCLGSYGPWLSLIMMQHKPIEKLYTIDLCFLYNPLSSEFRPLPRLDWLPNIGDNDIAQVRLSCLPSDPRCTIAAFTSTDIFVCKPDDDAWKKVDYSFGPGSEIHDSLFQTQADGRLVLFVVDEVGKITSFDVVGNTVVPSNRGTNTPIIENNLPPDVFASFNLALDSTGQVLVIVNYDFTETVYQVVDDVVDEEQYGEEHQYRIVVQKLQQGRLVGLNNLGGGMIFIGGGCTCYCSGDGAAPVNEFFVKDCVYYLETIDDDEVFDHKYEVWRFPAQSSTFILPDILDVHAEGKPMWIMPLIK